MRPLVRATTLPGWALTASKRLSALWLLLVAPGVIDAQTAAQRRAIDAYADSLRTLVDTGLLRREEGGLLAAAWLNRNDPFYHLRLAHVALRLGDLSGVEHYDDAASEFRTAGQLAPRWPYAWFGLGLAELALGARAGAADDRSILVRDAWSRAAFAFARATTLEPGFAPRLEGLVMEALRHRAPDRAGVVRDALLHSAGASRHPRLVLALGRVQRAMGDSLSLRAFETLVEVSDSSALALLELGRTRLLYGHRDGLEPYLTGASSDDPAAVQEARADLLPLATPAELADYDLRRGVSRAAMVRRFWTTRDRLDFREDGERLGEHLRRLAEARRLYLVLDEVGNERLDDRGRIYVRHGPPGDRASLQDPGVEPNESWRYLRDGRDIILHFVARDAPTDFRLVESVADISTIRVGFASATNAAAGLRAGLIDGSERLIRSRAALSPRYRDAPLGDPARLQAFFAEERAAGRRSIQVSGSTDTYPPRYARALDAWGSLVVAGSVNDAPRVQVLFVIPGHALEPAAGQAAVVYPVRVRFAAFTENGEEAVAADTVLRLERSGRVPSNRSLAGAIALPVPPGGLIARAAVEYGGDRGTLFRLDTLRVPDPAGGELDLGEPLIGSRRPQLPLAFDDGLTISLAPGGVVHREDELDLAVEVFGLEAAEDAELRVLLAPLIQPGPIDPQALAWRPFPGDEAVGRVRGGDNGAVHRWRALLPLSRVRPGEWALAVEATDASGRVVRRVAPLTVLAP